MNGVVIYREVQQFRQVWLWMILTFSALMAWWAFFQQVVLKIPFGNRPSSDWVIWVIWLIVGVALPWLFFALKLVVEVRKEGIHAYFSPLYKRTISFQDLKDYRVVKYRPILDYGGWGIRFNWRRELALNVAGNCGVRFELKSGRKILIGSQSPEKLARAVGEALKIAKARDK